ncbi:RDD family protein [Kitasatospora cathayae]|uniref:RDD family protein n=1 Tax=Kitasatospora cathayae TaxID=3004092 RepID=A0ABY7Q7J3_9ACTN|nr:RDD family protein [Kitasatospora sp. HUAS 3-15]WBP88639.1 RDD family protein [Kitasatospora sp. HUAS 3-15]
MTDRSFAADGDPAVAPEPGYYPDPSIPGFVRYWGGSAWVPGTTRPAPAEGEVLQPPRFVSRRPAPDVAAAARTVPPPVVSGPAPGPGVSAPSPSPNESPSPLPSSSPSPSPFRGVPGSGDTGPVYLDQTTGGASFVVGPRVAEVIGGPVFRTVEPAAEEAAGVSGASGWQADPRAQRGLTETGGSPRWVSWGVLPGAPEEEEGRAEAERAPVAVEVATAVAPAVAVAVREVPAPIATAVAVPVVEVAAEVAAEELTVPARAEASSAGAAVPAPVSTPVPVPVPGPAAAPAAPLPVVRPAREATVRRRRTAPVPAGLGRRLVARVVDTAVLLVVAVAAGIPLGSSVSDHLQQKLDQARMASSLTRRQVQVWLVDDVVLGKLAALLGILVFVSLVYEVLPIARTGQTFGKRLARIRVVDATAIGDRTRLSLGRSLLRWIVRQLGVVLLLGLVWPVFDRPARRGWQDRAARTRVVRG